MPAKAKKSKKKSAKKTVRKTTKRPAKRSMKKTVKKSAKKSVKKPAKKSVRRAPKKAVKKTAMHKTSTRKAIAPKPAAPASSMVATPTAKPTTFSLDAPSGWDVSLAGSFNKWEPRPMVKDPDGVWRITFDLEPGTYQYRFLVDTEWRDDPNNSNRQANEFGGYNSVVTVS